ncbi:MAG TPA: amidase family protein, partial [Caulobacteraceae bacterium]|nr:amidase family protein [Caulobacteraceae bacterium]
PIDDEVLGKLHETAEALRAFGHEVVERGLGIDYRTTYRAQALVSASNFAAGMRRRIEKLGREPADDEIEGLARRALLAGRQITGEQAMWGWQQLRLSNRQILANFEEFDVYLTPVLGTPPPRHEFLDTLTDDLRAFDKAQSKTFPFTPPFNFTGQPSMSLPLHMSEGGLPIAMMFTARYADEATLFRLAGQLEKEMPWRDRRPAVWN